MLETQPTRTRDTCARQASLAFHGAPVTVCVLAVRARGPVSERLCDVLLNAPLSDSPAAEHPFWIFL